MTKPAYATPAQILAAQTLIELAERDGKPVEDLWLRVAAATPRVRRPRAPRAATQRAS